MAYKLKQSGDYRKRRNFSMIKNSLAISDLLEVQTESYKWFATEGIKEVFETFSPIESFSGSLSLEFGEYEFGTPRYSIKECKDRQITYAAPLKVQTRLFNNETGEVKEQEIFLGDMPLMTDAGTFIINGAERVVVSQLVRSPSVYYSKEIDKNGKPVFASKVIPSRGTWLEYETDAKDVIYIRIDRNRKVPMTTLLRAVGLSSDEDILSLFDNDVYLKNTIEKDSTHNTDEALIEIYEKLRPGEPTTLDSSKNQLITRFFDDFHYDLAKVGRYKFNKKLNVKDRLLGNRLAEDIIIDGEVKIEKGTLINKEVYEELCTYLDNGYGVTEAKVNEDLTINSSIDEHNKIQVIHLYSNVDDKKIVKVIGNDPSANIMNLTMSDFYASVSYYLNLNEGIGKDDEIDHLGNRRVKQVGELLQNQFRIGLTRLERVVRERMTIQDLDVITPQTLINTKPITSSIKEFFGSSQLSQFMDQTNPLSELTHKRRISALGPGGLSRERAGFEVRDIHYTHYGRLCPVESPEGPNIGLISALSSFAIINEYGFVETPYRKVVDGKVTDEIMYMSADEEDKYIIAQASEPVDEEGKFINDRIRVRHREEITVADKDKVNFVDVSPKQLVSVAAAMIPFLEHDDVKRSLMGSNMQRQAVPLLTAESPIVGTGIEYRAARDSGITVLAKSDGIVEKVTGDEIRIRNKKDEIDTYRLRKFKRTNGGTCINQRPVVVKGEKVKAGDLIADGPSTKNGEMALGKNVLIAFTTWEGYNYEDAVLINERLVKEDVYTSIHIEEYDCECRDTKLGPEEITRDIPNVGDDSLKDLDENGIIRIGAEVRPGDILVGKVTPKGETELTAEERLLRAIFGEKAREVRDTSLRVPHGEAGTIVDIKIFTRENSDELGPGVNQIIRCYIATKRKISVGDKMAGRHGNKGVISRILPEEDMPFLPDGTPVDIVLNPLGVPSRMNLGQVLEVHLGMAAKALGWKVATPVFDGATDEEIRELLKKAGLSEDGKTILYDGRTGEAFDHPITVGVMYMLKLHHLVDDKIHARSTGPYSVITQQPLGGKAQFGGQRFGEMEVWALEAYGAAYTLQEMLTTKSDDVVGRVKTYEAIVKGENVPEPGVPEGFKVLIKELQSLGLDIQLYSVDNKELELKENIEDGIDFNFDSGKEDAVDENDLNDGYIEEDGEELGEDMLLDDIDGMLDEDEILIDDTDLGEDDLLEDQDMLDE